jgi:hypothetical protein
MQISMPGADKLAHVIVGAVIAAVVGAVAAAAGVAEARAIGAAAAAGSGAGKEVADYLLNLRAAERGEPGRHGIELADFLATTAGGLFVWAAAVWTQ